MYRHTRSGEKIKVNIIQRTTSETIRLGKIEPRPRSLSNRTAMSANVPQRKCPSSSFQITGVSVIQKTDAGDDSADDLDESRTDDISRLDNETPSYSEDTFSRDTDDPQSCYAGAVNSSNSPCYTTSSQYGLTVVPSGGTAVTVTAAATQAPTSTVTRPVASVAASVASQPSSTATVSQASTNPPPAVSEAAKPPVTTSTRNIGDRFKVVKIESIVPFYRGRWKCIDYLDHSIHTPKDAYVYCDQQYVRASTLQQAKYTQAKQNTDPKIVGQAQSVPTAAVNNPVTIGQAQPIYNVQTTGICTPLMTAQTQPFQTIVTTGTFINNTSNIPMMSQMNQMSNIPTCMVSNVQMYTAVSQVSNVPMYSNANYVSNTGMYTSASQFSNMQTYTTMSQVSNAPMYSTMNQVSNIPTASNMQAYPTNVSMYATPNQVSNYPMYTAANQVSNTPMYTSANYISNTAMYASGNQVSNVPMYSNANYVSNTATYTAANQISNTSMYATVSQACNIPTSMVQNQMSNNPVMNQMTNVPTCMYQASNIAPSVIMSQPSNMNYQRQISAPAPVQNYATPATNQVKSAPGGGALKAFTACDPRTTPYCQSQPLTNYCAAGDYTYTSQSSSQTSSQNYVQTSNVSYNTQNATVNCANNQVLPARANYVNPQVQGTSQTPAGQTGPGVTANVSQQNQVPAGQVFSVSTQGFSASATYVNANTPRQSYNSAPGVQQAQQNQQSSPSSPVGSTNQPVQHVHHIPINQNVYACVSNYRLFIISNLAVLRLFYLKFEDC